MFNNLINKTLYEKRVFLIGWSLGLILMAGITVAFYPTIKGQIGQLFENVPKALQSVTGTPEDYKSISGYVGTGVFDLRIPMLTLTMSIILALGLSVGEETSGKMYQLLAQPISRRAIVLQKWLAMIIILALSHALLLVGIEAVIKSIHESMPIAPLINASVMLFLLSLSIGSLTTFLGFGWGRKGLATLLITAYTFGSYLLTSFALQIEWLKYIEPFSLFHYYKASEVIKLGYNPRHVAVLILISLLSVFFGALLFNNRDIGIHSAS